MKIFIIVLLFHCKSPLYIAHCMMYISIKFIHFEKEKNSYYALRGLVVIERALTILILRIGLWDSSKHFVNSLSYVFSQSQLSFSIKNIQLFLVAREFLSLVFVLLKFALCIIFVSVPIFCSHFVSILKQILETLILAKLE